MAPLGSGSLRDRSDGNPERVPKPSREGTRRAKPAEFPRDDRSLAPILARWHASEDARGARRHRLGTVPTPPARRAYFWRGTFPFTQTSQHQRRPCWQFWWLAKFTTDSALPWALTNARQRNPGPFSSVHRGEGWDEESGEKWPLTPALPASLCEGAGLRSLAAHPVHAYAVTSPHRAVGIGKTIVKLGVRAGWGRLRGRVRP
jgi:hypothetical protein